MSRFLQLTDLDGEPAFILPYYILGASRRGDHQTQILVQDSAHALYVRESPQEIIDMVNKLEEAANRAVTFCDGPELEPDEEP